MHGGIRRGGIISRGPSEESRGKRSAARCMSQMMPGGLITTRLEARKRERGKGGAQSDEPSVMLPR
jgi:hypothetical protein